MSGFRNRFAGIIIVVLVARAELNIILVSQHKIQSPPEAEVVEVFFFCRIVEFNGKDNAGWLGGKILSTVFFATNPPLLRDSSAQSREEDDELQSKQAKKKRQRMKNKFYVIHVTVAALEGRHPRRVHESSTAPQQAQHPIRTGFGHGPCYFYCFF